MEIANSWEINENISKKSLETEKSQILHFEFLGSFYSEITIRSPDGDISSLECILYEEITHSPPKLQNITKISVK